MIMVLDMGSSINDVTIGAVHPDIGNFRGVGVCQLSLLVDKSGAVVMMS